jgi:phosphate transport system substrate-binding protein
MLLTPPWLAGAAARAASPAAAPEPLRYAGSSTIANFLRDAEPAYRRVQFLLDTEPESAGGERAILEGRCDLAGIAGRPRRETLEAGVVATLIGHDAIAVVVNRANPVPGLSRAQLRDVFTGRIPSWTAFGGLRLPVHPYIVGRASATRNVLRSAVLGEADYAGCTEVRPDADVPARIEADPGGIGAISFSFLDSCRGVRMVAVDREEPTPTNPRYPIFRPLHLLWWPTRERASQFVAWTRTPRARAVLMRRFALPSTLPDRGDETGRR